MLFVSPGPEHAPGTAMNTWDPSVKMKPARHETPPIDTRTARRYSGSHDVGLSSTEIIETVIQTGPYSGLASALNALAALSQALR